MTQSSRCVHFTGVQNDVCAAGVRYDDVRNDAIQTRFSDRLPCLSSAVPCPSRRLPTTEEIEAEERALTAMMEAVETARACIIAVSQGKRGASGSTECPVCDGGTLRYSIAKMNDHIHAACTTPACVKWME